MSSVVRRQQALICLKNSTIIATPPSFALKIVLPFSLFHLDKVMATCNLGRGRRVWTWDSRSGLVRHVKGLPAQNMESPIGFLRKEGSYSGRTLLLKVTEGTSIG